MQHRSCQQIKRIVYSCLGSFLFFAGRRSFRCTISYNKYFLNSSRDASNLCKQASTALFTYLHGGLIICKMLLVFFSGYLLLCVLCMFTFWNVSWKNASQMSPATANNGNSKINIYSSAQVHILWNNSNVNNIKIIAIFRIVMEDYVNHLIIYHVHCSVILHNTASYN